MSREITQNNEDAVNGANWRRMKSPSPKGGVLVLEPVRISDAIRFGEDCELDVESYTLRRAGRVLKLERIPMEILLFLVEQKGQLVSRQQIVERIWGEKVFPRYRQQH